MELGEGNVMVKQSTRVLSIDMTKALVFLCVFSTIALRNWGWLMYASQFIMVLAVILHLSRKATKFQAGIYVLFYGSFATWCLLSAVWAADPTRAISGSLGVVHFVVLGAAIAGYTISERNPGFFLDCLAWSVLGLVVVLCILTPLSVWVEALEPTMDASSDANRLGYTVNYHPNALGRIVSFGALIWVYKARTRSVPLPVAYLAIASMVAVLILTKSRLSIILFVVVLVLFFLATSRSTGLRLVRLLSLCLALWVLVWSLMNVPMLYDVVGIRFAGLFGVGGAVDASTSTRSDMVSVALDLYSRYPLTGVGFDNYAYHYFNEYSGWAATYAHNTYAELLADLGVVGLVFYYAVPLWVTYYLARNFFSGSRPDSALVRFLAFLAAAQLAADFASISYTSDFVQFTTVLLFSWVTIDRQHHRGAVLN